ncbi:hypothetical protein C8J55DRAFT_511451 [Lentinula edodes]|uniref:Uncharacterized protein n=1 Tax=Lentinula lateritia TaxID=40482 RepID=A0A9W9AHY1_9AGAR|nr:hypothetical protein C8J55DRAFT_511451 [Lentinula edodes]
MVRSVPVRATQCLRVLTGLTICRLVDSLFESSFVVYYAIPQSLPVSATVSNESTRRSRPTVSGSELPLHLEDCRAATLFVEITLYQTSMIKPSLTWTSWEIVPISCGTILKLLYIAAVLKLFCYFRDALLLEVKCGLLVAWRRWCIASSAQVCSNAVVHIVQPKLYPVLHFLLLISVAFACCYCLST